MRRRTLGKLPLRNPLPPRAAQVAIVDLEKTLLDENEAHRVNCLLRDYVTSDCDPVNHIVVTVVGYRRKLEPGILINNNSGMWLFDYPHCRIITGTTWSRWVRFDVLRDIKENFATVGFTLYDGNMPIEDRLSSDRYLTESELSGGHVYAHWVEPFFRYATKSIERYGVPASAHRIPKMA